MHDETKKILRMFLIISGLCIVVVVSTKPKPVPELLALFAYPTLVFLPSWYLIVKYNLFAIGSFTKKYSKIITAFSLVVGSIFVPKIPSEFRLCIIVYGFEVVCLYYATLSKDNRKTTGENNTEEGGENF